ncbi:MAG: CPBP family intramembrane metalloprotease [Planctomycetes bacterium]|nr:CPBP family intramembrane metalloprotease [Planctomycetota bacterium]
MIDPAFEPRYWDMIAVAVMVGVLPQWTTFFTMPRMRALPPDVQDRIRPRFYIEAMALQWLLAFVALNHFLFGDLPLDQLGLSLQVERLPELAMGAVAAIGLLAFIGFQRIGIRKHPEGRQLVRKAIARYDWIIPRSKSQKRIWLLVSVHAGIGEELFFRGFLLAALNWYLPLWAAACIAVVMFGFAHTYQGVKGIVSTAVVGGVLMVLYLVTGSLWVSMFAHAVYDIQGGLFAHWALYREDAPRYA